MRVEGVLVLLFPSHVKAFGNNFTCAAHMLIVKRAPQAVVDNCIDQGAVAQTVTFARFRNQVGRVRHRFHSASNHDFSVAQLHSLRGHHDGFQS